MNPWELLLWVAVICLSLLIVAITIFFILSMIRGARGARRRRETVTNVHISNPIDPRDAAAAVHRPGATRR